MKYKYIGEDHCFCIELIAYGIMSRDKLLMNGDVINVSDDNTRVLDSLDASGIFVKIGKKNKKRK